MGDILVDLNLPTRKNVIKQIKEEKKSYIDKIYNEAIKEEKNVSKKQIEELAEIFEYGFVRGCVWYQNYMENQFDKLREARKEVKKK
jgi:hypothetical protein